MSQYGLKNFLRIADTYVNADTTTLEGVEKWLVSWFCFTYNCPPNDPRLLEMTVEELLVLFQMHRIKQDPTIVTRELHNTNDYEEWLKKEMGEDYISEGDQIKWAETKKEERDRKEEKLDLPDEITTDFSELHEKLNNE